MKKSETQPAISEDLSLLLDQAWKLSRERHGNRLTAHIPGMFVVNGTRGRYRAVSITGAGCDLGCEHCRGKLLVSMPAADEPEKLLALGREAAARGDAGMLITGGCDAHGRLPWRDFLPVIAELKETTDLFISAHPGMIDARTARSMKRAGVDQALVDVIGDEDTARKVYHLADGTRGILQTLDSLADAGLEIVPHILFGLHYGKLRGEKAAAAILNNYPLKKYVVVALMPFKGTPMEDVTPPEVEEVVRFLAETRLELPHLLASLGCARPRGLYRRRLDPLAIRAGVNSIALATESALDLAAAMGLEIERKPTCCSLG